MIVRWSGNRSRTIILDQGRVVAGGLTTEILGDEILPVALRNEVNALIKSGKLTPAEGQSLINAAQAIMDSL